ncbi:MAG: hypothetical protein DSM106950_44000 [Stigonema ocellatum SAG 48.90 = DSM 106950]|nr:hypothetical protein [Stigonema ocellatum SAG 48.90 = DSM 106950]
MILKGQLPWLMYGQLVVVKHCSRSKTVQSGTEEAQVSQEERSPECFWLGK